MKLVASIIIVLITYALELTSSFSFNNNNNNGNSFLKNIESAFKKSPKVELPVDFKVPEPQPLTITRKRDIPNLLTGSLALAFRLGTGAFTLGWRIDSIFYNDNDKNEGKYSLKLGPFSIRDSSSRVLGECLRPKEPLILYEYEASPFCRRVREMCNLLDLPVEYRPCPGARAGFSDELFARTGRRTVPYLIDPNTNLEMFESDDQIQYLLDTYGPEKHLYDPKALWPITFKPFALYTSVFASQVRGFAGSKPQANRRPDNLNMKPIELWAYECSPFVRPVREKLSTLCLPHVMISCSRGSANRDLLKQNTGNFQVPYIKDPNTGIEMFESPEIVDYLEAVYTVKK